MLKHVISEGIGNELLLCPQDVISDSIGNEQLPIELGNMSFLADLVMSIYL